MNDLVPLKDFTPADLELWIQEAGQPAYRARQLLKWIYAQNVEDFQEMTDVSKDFRGWLEQHARIPSVMREKVLTDKDGTRKLLFRLLDGESIESVLIDEERRLTLCVSSQVGCALGCRFCLTGEQGYRRNLSAGEIVDQEPLANLQQVAKALEIITSDHGLNFSTRKVTLSTVGLVPEMLELSRLFPIKLAVSLHAADNETRARIMPINRRYPLEELLEACRQLELPRRQRITFEYLLLAGVNDSSADARKLAKLLKGLRAKINLIPFNEYPGSPFKRPSPNRIEDFQKILQEKHYTATVRQSRGAGIMAACGQLTHSP
jgi:23S rRNA (adenine2503-C2)-methyltransferase